ncbi:MAG: hypothetical protein LBR95_02270 [Azoarcus sp.]|jgi:hypothetical protein|nr:hypothetical protein [Azoarcus sp.]
MPRPITDTLRHIGGGVFLDTASDAMADLVNAVSSSGKAGKITLEVAIKRPRAAGR